MRVCGSYTIFKRLILSVLTILAIARILFSLESSLTQPQIQSRLELYQTNLLLHAAELSSKDNDLNSAVDNLIGKDPYESAEKQYQQARKVARVSRSNYQAQLQQLSSGEKADAQIDRVDLKIIEAARAAEEISPQQKELQEAIAEVDQFIHELDLNIGILEAVRGETKKAIEVWNNLSSTSYQEIGTILTQLWSPDPQISANGETQIKDNLNSWFRYRALEKLYQVQDRREDLLALQTKEQETAYESILKLAFISGIPVFGGIIGVGLLIFLLAQLLVKKEQSLLATNSAVAWETPWNWEITWQVLIVGFFFIGQFVLPIVLGLSGFNPTGLSLRGKALYVLVSYLSMSLAGLLVLSFSIKSFFPLPKDWFRFKFFAPWTLWGLGGYLIALPVVVLVSIVNQQFWQGQGGSNPLLFLALQAQDRIALGIFFFTASIAAPVFEETIFRGFLLPSLTRYFPVGGAIVISSFIFSIAHLSLSEVLPLTALGIILGVVYTRSRNLLAPIFLHSLWNSGTLLSLFILGSGS